MEPSAFYYILTRLYLIYCFSSTAFSMPKSYLKSQTPPNNPVNDWLLWSASQLESFIGNPSNKIASILGINKAGDWQYIIMPTIVPKALGAALVVIGNSTDASSKPAFVYLDMSNLGYTSVIETHALIPREICPEEQLPTKYLNSTTWETAKVPLVLVCVPIIAPVFFGMPFIEANIHDSDFDEKLALLSPTHLIIQVFTLPKDKWKEAQEELQTFFKCNPSPVCQPRPSSTSPISSPIGITFSTNVRAATPVIIPNATALQQTLVGGTIDFASPGSFIDPCIAKYTQAMENILLQPTLVRSISTVNILTTVFNKIPNNMAK